MQQSWAQQARQVALSQTTPEVPQPETNEMHQEQARQVAQDEAAAEEKRKLSDTRLTEIQAWGTAFVAQTETMDKLTEINVITELRLKQLLHMKEEKRALREKLRAIRDPNYAAERWAAAAEAAQTSQEPAKTLDEVLAAEVQIQEMLDQCLQRMDSTNAQMQKIQAEQDALEKQLQDGDDELRASFAAMRAEARAVARADAADVAVAVEAVASRKPVNAAAAEQLVLLLLQGSDALDSGHGDGVQVDRPGAAGDDSEPAACIAGGFGNSRPARRRTADSTTSRRTKAAGLLLAEGGYALRAELLARPAEELVRWAEVLGLPLADIETAAAAGGSDSVVELIMAATGIPAPAVKVDKPTLPLDLAIWHGRGSPDGGGTISPQSLDLDAFQQVMTRSFTIPCLVGKGDPVHSCHGCVGTGARPRSHAGRC